MHVVHVFVDKARWEIPVELEGLAEEFLAGPRLDRVVVASRLRFGCSSVRFSCIPIAARLRFGCGLIALPVQFGCASVAVPLHLDCGSIAA